MACIRGLSCRSGEICCSRRHRYPTCLKLSTQACLDRALQRVKINRLSTRCPAYGDFAPYTLAEASGGLPLGLIVSGLRAFCYSQVTYVTASMLANSLPKTDLRIVQVGGGGIKELYYYPSTTVQIMQDGAVARRQDAPFYEPAAHSQPVRSPQNTHGLGACKTFAQLGLRHKVTVMDENAKEGLLQEASVQAGVPVQCRKEPVNALGRMVKSSADAIVLLSTLQEVKDMSAFLKDCHAVLKPGGRLIFIQPVKDGEAASPLQSLVGSAAQALDLNKLDPLKGNGLFRDVQWDFANESIDPHIVGFAVAAD